MESLDTASTGELKQIMGPHNVRFDEILRPHDADIYMGLRREVYDIGDRIHVKDTFECRPIADIGLFEYII